MESTRFTGIQIKELRKLKGLTQDQLSKKLQISKRTLQRLEDSKSDIDADLQLKLQIIFGDLTTSYESVKTIVVKDLNKIIYEIEGIKRRIKQAIELYE